MRQEFKCDGVATVFQLCFAVDKKFHIMHILFKKGFKSVNIGADFEYDTGVLTCVKPPEKGTVLVIKRLYREEYCPPVSPVDEIKREYGA